jgi:hypothetical protein
LAGPPPQGAELSQQAGPGQAAESSRTQPANPPGEEAELSPISGPRELLRSHGVDDSCFESLADGQPLSDPESETLLKVMFWMLRDFRRQDVEQWARRELDLDRLVDNPKADRGQLFLLSGRVTGVEVRRPLPAVAQRFELDQYYRCEFVLDGRQQPAVIFAAGVPRRWQEGKPIDERAGAFGLFLKLTSRDPARPVPLFVSPHMAWHPPTLLGRLGMDVALLDDVVDRTGLGHSRRLDEQEVSRAAREREAFYAMLDAVARAKPDQLLREAREQLKHADAKLKRTDKQGSEYFSVVPLFLEPQGQRGRLVALSGKARRVVSIRVEDPDIVARFGIDHYYEISLFTDASQDNPVVFCVRELPHGMPTGDGPEYVEQVRVAGFFFKLWTYQLAPSGELPENDRSRGAFRQPAPLLIGLQPVWYPQQPMPINPIAGAIAGGLFLLALLGIWLALWQSGRGDKRFHDQTIAKTQATGPRVSLDQLKLGAGSPVDSGKLEGTDREDRVGNDD